MRPDQSRPKRRGQRESPDHQASQRVRQGHPAAFRQHGGGLLDHQSGQFIRRQCGRGLRREWLLALAAGAPDRSVPGRGNQQEHLATSYQDPRVQGQRCPLQLRRVHVRPEHQCGKRLRVGRPLVHAQENPADPNSKSVDALLENLTTYKNRNGGVWGRGERHVFKNLKSADNAIGFTHSTGSFGDDLFTSLVVDSLFVGETDNIGNPVTPEEKVYGRSLPKRLIPDFPIRAYEYYDYRHDVVNTTFVNYQENKQRGSGALSWLLFTGAGVTTENTVKGAKFVNAKPVYFPKIDPRFDSDNRNATAYRTLAIHDRDGSTTGIPDSYVLLHDGENDSVATDDTCKNQPTWNASVCAGDIGRIQFSIRRPGPTRGAGLALRDVAVRSAAPTQAAAPRG